MTTPDPLQELIAGTPAPMTVPVRPLETGNYQVGISRVRYSHDAMIDLVLAQPMISQRDIAKHFGYTETWVSVIFNSDAFQARLAQRKADLVDPILSATLDDRLRAVAQKSLDIVLEKLHQPVVGFKDALEAATMATKGLGMGQAKQGPVVNAQFVVAMPQKSEDASSWAARYGARSPGLAAMVAEVPPQVIEAAAAPQEPQP